MILKAITVDEQPVFGVDSGAVIRRSPKRSTTHRQYLADKDTLPGKWLTLSVPRRCNVYCDGGCIRTLWHRVDATCGG